MIDWHIFVIFHKAILNSCYSLDSSYDKNNFTFIKCGNKLPAERTEKHKIIMESDFEIFDPTLQSRTYMAPSAIYHAYKNNLYKYLDYIGFIEYDMQFKEGTTKEINRICNGEKLVTPFSFRHQLKRLSSQSEIKMNGSNSIHQIIIDYNNYFGTNYSFHNIKNKTDLVGTQQSFLMDTDTFQKIMKFISFVIENKYCERENSWERPSTIMDRYFALCMYFEQHEGTRFIPIPLEHLNYQQW